MTEKPVAQTSDGGPDGWARYETGGDPALEAACRAFIVVVGSDPDKTRIVIAGDSYDTMPYWRTIVPAMRAALAVSRFPPPPPRPPAPEGFELGARVRLRQGAFKWKDARLRRAEASGRVGVVSAVIADGIPAAERAYAVRFERKGSAKEFEEVVHARCLEPASP